MIAVEHCMELILLEFPGFRQSWEEYVADWHGDNRGLICNDMSAFSHYAIDLIEAGDTKELPRIFAYVERLMIEGDDNVQTAAATCFLENIVNRDIPASAYAHFLGSESLDYCRGWDEFMGGKTAGLHDPIETTNAYGQAQ
jgi:hypothetical protein